MTEAPVFLDAHTVRQRLEIGPCIALMREAMIALSTGGEAGLLRSFIPLGEGQTFAIMPAALPGDHGFGAKLVSVYATGQTKTHEGLIVLFERETGRPVCVADAGEITRIRTAAMSAAATDILARPKASRLAVLGTGVQARTHIEAIRRVRPVDEIRIWGRNTARAEALAAGIARETGIVVGAFTDAGEAVSGADIVCTVTASRDPVLEGGRVRPGTHVNLVGSSGPAAAETDAALLVSGRVFPDHRPHVLAHGGEYLRAVEAGLYEESRLGPEIGDVLAGRAPGRTAPGEITVFKSLGHAVQDLTAAAWLYSKAKDAE